MKIFKFRYLLQAWWLFVIMIAIALGPKVAYAAEVTMGSGGNLIFEPNEITISAGDTVTFVNGELPPHNMIVKDHPELCLLYTSPSPRDRQKSRMPSSA